MVLRTEVRVPPALGVCVRPMTPRGAGFIPQDGPAAGGVTEDAQGCTAAGWSNGLKSAFRSRWACVRAPDDAPGRGIYPAGRSGSRGRDGGGPSVHGCRMVLRTEVRVPLALGVCARAR